MFVFVFGACSLAFNRQTSNDVTWPVVNPGPVVRDTQLTMQKCAVTLMVTISGARGFDHRGEKALVDFVNSLAPAPCGALLSWWRPVDYTQLKKAAVITSCERIVEAGGAGGGFIADPSTPCVADGSTEAAVVGNNACVTASPLSPSFCGAPDAPCAIAANCYWERVAPKGSEDARQRVYTDEDAADEEF